MIVRASISPWEERTITNLSVSRLAPYPLCTRFPRRMIVIRQIRRERDSRVENSGLRRVLPGKSPAPHLSLENTPATTVLERADILLEATRLLARADLLRGAEAATLRFRSSCRRMAVTAQQQSLRIF